MICSWCKEKMRGGEKIVQKGTFCGDDGYEYTDPIHERCYWDEITQRLLGDGWREP